MYGRYDSCRVVLIAVVLLGGVNRRAQMTMVRVVPLISIIAVSICGLLASTDAFVTRHGDQHALYLPAQSYPSTLTSSTSLAATSPNKKRRRRKTKPSTSDELPEFELRDEITIEEGPTTKKREAGTFLNDPFDGDITPSMMASSSAMGSARSLKDLLKDRAIEKNIDFDEPSQAAEELPDLLAMARQQQEPGKKKKRQAARIAAAEAAKAAEEKTNIFAKIPFIVDEKGNVSGVKILENGTWLGIGLLVAWEIYINSPFFERAQPMIPVVYDLLA